MVEIIIKYLGGIGIITGGIIYLIKKISELFFNKQLKAYELELQHKSDDYKHELNLSLENQKKELNEIFQKAVKLHEKRLEIISKLYKHIVNLESGMQIMTQEWKLATANEETNKKDEDERVRIASEHYNKFSGFYVKNKIFFNENTCALVDKIRSEFYDSFWDYTAKNRFGFTDFDLNYKNAAKASKVIRENIPPVLKQLEEDFRQIIGVN